MAKKLRWNQTPEGKQRQSEIMKQVRRAKKGAWKHTIKRDKHSYMVCVTGKDTLHVFAQILSLVQKNDWNVAVKMERQ